MKHTFTFKHIKKLFSLLAIATLTLTTCNKKNNTQLTGTAYVQFTNASADDSPVDFYVSTTKENSLPLRYNQSTDYFSISAGQILPASIKVNVTGVSLASMNLNPLPDVHYSIFYFGGVTSSYVDDLSIAAGKARVRFINLDKTITGNLDYGITGAATPLATNIAPAYDSAYYSVAPGSSFSVYATGTNTSMLDIPTTIEAGHVYTVYLSGSATSALTGTVLLQK